MALKTPVEGGILASRAKGLFVAGKSRDAKPDAPATFYSKILFTHGALKSPEMMNILKAMQEAGREKFGKNFDAMWKEGGIRSPIRKEVATKGYDADAYGAFITAKAWEDNPPVVLTRGAVKTTDQSLFYPGALVRVTLKVRCYGGGSTGYSPGIALDLLGVQHVGKGERLAGGSGDGADGLDALEDFGALDGDSNDLDSLLGN